MIYEIQHSEVQPSQKKYHGKLSLFSKEYAYIFFDYSFASSISCFTYI